VASLVEAGHAGTTTSGVCQRAGVSQGALFRHFPAKSELLGATARHLFAALIEDFRRAFDAIEGEADVVGAAFRALGEVFAQPRLLAALELYTAARSDAELRKTLAPVLAEHRANLRAEAGRVLAAAGVGAAAQAGPRLDALVDVVMAALQGGALGALVLPDADAEGRGRALLERMLRRELSACPS
jgi:AcrR family transcriptional regulator